MSATDQVQSLADFLFDLLTNQPPDMAAQQGDLMAELVRTLEAEGFRGISNEQLADALESVERRLTLEQNNSILELGDSFDINLSEVTNALTTDFEDSIRTLEASQIAPLREAIANQPDPVIHQYVSREVTEVQNVTNVTRVREGDQVIEQNTVNQVAEGGTLNITDQRTAVQADDGAVAVGDGIEDSAVNTGNIDGVQAGGDVDADQLIVGDENALITDNEIDALALGGDASSVDAEGNANVGGTQIDIEAGGDANAIVGDENDLAGDQTAILGDPSTDIEIENEIPSIDYLIEEEVAAEHAAAEELEAELDA